VRCCTAPYDTARCRSAPCVSVALRCVAAPDRVWTRGTVPNRGRNLLETGVFNIYFRQGGYVIVVVCLSVCLATETSERICMKFSGKVGNGPMNKMIKFWWRSGSRIRKRIRIAILVRRALAEVCTAPVLLVQDMWWCITPIHNIFINYSSEKHTILCKK